jgi:eukaryotic-like serine/threonine-protein kinase
VTSSSDPLVGKHIDGYRIEKLIAHGGMGAVYRALDVSLKRQVALKVIHALKRQDEEYIRRLEREAQSVAQLIHPHIVQVYRFGEADGIYYIAMQYIEGSDLGWLLKVNRIAGATMPIAQVMGIIQGITGALDYAHSRGIIHRDVKPANILVDSQQHAYLSDFGIARLPGAETHSGFLGSPFYMSPEQIMEGGKIVPQTDLYSLGITLFEMLTNHIPFVGDGTVQVAIQHLSQTPLPPSYYNPTLPSSIDQVVLKLLSKQPEDRYQTAQETFEALQQSVNEWQSGGDYTQPISRPQPASPKQGALVFSPLVDISGETIESVATPLSVQAVIPSANAAPTERRSVRQRLPRLLPLVGALVGIGILALIFLVYNASQPAADQAALLTTPVDAETDVPVEGVSEETPSTDAPETPTNAPALRPLLQDTTEEVSPTNEPPLEATATENPASPTPLPLLETATPIPAATIASSDPPAAAAPTSTTVSSPVDAVADGRYALLIASNGAESLLVVNLSVSPFPLGSLRLGDGETSVTGSEWGVSPLENGACVAVWSPEGMQPPAMTCSTVGSRLTRSAQGSIWNKPLAIYYNDVRVGTCLDPVCFVRIIT